MIGNTLYILGGEIQPREPATPFMYSYDLKGTSCSEILEILNPDQMIQVVESEQAPPIRVGAASVVVDGKIYLWGEEAGKQ